MNNNINASVLLQETNFQLFVYNYLKQAHSSGALEEEQVRLFIGPGYIMHHLLDAYLHPLIIYYAGDHTPDATFDTWHHGCVENLIDIYMMKHIEKKDPNHYPVYHDFTLPKTIISNSLIQTLNDCLRETYALVSGGEIFYESFYQMALFMKIFKYDHYGIKKKIFDKVDPIYHGASSFSYHRDVELAIPFLNQKREEWVNPYDASLHFYYTFMDLYEMALIRGAYIIEELEKICMSGNIYKDDIYDLIPDVNSVTGLSCEKHVKLLNRKQWDFMPKLF